MTPHDTPREARKKLLLLEGQLHRLDLIEARQAWRTVGREGLLRATLPGSLGAALKSRGGRLLLTALPLCCAASRSGAGRAVQCCWPVAEPQPGPCSTDGCGAMKAG